jgi:uncharacterized protein YndB with AHSA1/START domain
MNAAALAVLAIGLAATGDTREKTGRAVVVEAVVEAPPADVFRLWTTNDGVRSFFAPDGRIDAKAGGLYEIVFDPKSDPEGARAGTKGARVLRIEPGKRLDFEWSVGVPDVTWELKGTDFSTWVEVTFEPVPGRPGATRVRLAHEGFRSGGSWDTAHAYFGNAWRVVLDRLTVYCAEGRKPW